jgi:hypothetical protein
VVVAAFADHFGGAVDVWGGLADMSSWSWEGA